jgi:DNA-binding NarL/FixJ family response regulator
MDVAGGGLLYDGFMKRVYLADAQTDERSALRLMLLHLNLQVVGEAADWPTALAQAPATRPDMVVVDWDLVANGSGAAHSSSSDGTSGHALAELRLVCPTAVVIVLISHLDARQQAALSAGADAFISKSEMPDRVARSPGDPVWKLWLWTLFHRPRLFPQAIELAICGYHFRRVCELQK